MKMWNSALALLLALAAVHQSSSFSFQTTDSRIKTSLFSTIVERPPAETEEVYGTIVGDTKGAALFLDNVAISRGAEPLLKDINWSVQPNERWGIVGVNGA